MKPLSAQQLLAAMHANGHRVFEGELNLNIIGVRASDAQANTFNDMIYVLYQRGGAWQCKAYPATTDPGTYYREHPANVKGTAVLVPGRYSGCWQLGQHQGKYDALVQRGEMTVYRDNNSDAHIDTDTPTESGYFGINCHRANKHTTSKHVGKWSAGCQVLASPEHFSQFMNLCRDSASLYGPSFSYTLLTESETRL
ncbi:hypothetical protein [Pseudoalteromonas ruthenica]|uniref:hypothetical protein n=1 Tax=Pseudoalteromonas ruthenica TaxID=151081 RepID=UPI0003491DC9|nr:hypothetical protein [Pseudoalteromonas ruthenica]